MSIRLRLTLWYTAILFVALATFAFIIGQQIVQARSKDFDEVLKVGALQARENVEVLYDGTSATPIAIRYPDQRSFDRIEQQDSVYLQLFDQTGVGIQRSSGLNTYLPLTPTDFATARHLVGTFRDYRSVSGEWLRAYINPFQSNGQFLGVLVAARPIAPLANQLRSLVLLLAGGTLGATLLLALIVYAVAENALRPLSRMARDAARIQRAQDLSRQVRVPNTRDEVAALGRTFNDMLGRLDAAFESQRRFIADASHELRTPLTAIRGNADIMRQLGERMDPDERTEVLDEVAAEAERMSRLVNDLLTLARAQAGEQVQPRPVRLNEALESAVRAARGLARGHSILYAPVDAAFWVTGDPDRLKQLMLILLDNAVKYTPPDGHIWVWMRPVGQLVEVRVADDGPGIPADRLPHLFERFYRGGTPARGRDDGGAGLGLAIAQEIAQTFEGTISVESSVGHGTAFVVRFPVIAGPPDDEPVEQAAVPSPETVTIVS